MFLFCSKLVISNQVPNRKRLNDQSKDVECKRLTFEAAGIFIKDDDMVYPCVKAQENSDGYLIGVANRSI